MEDVRHLKIQIRDRLRIGSRFPVKKTLWSPLRVSALIHVGDCARGFHNFKVTGVVYNGSLNYVDVKVKCMRCGKLDTHINTK